ncbi:hypothetical protein KRX51_00345 [Corynebacterium sp. TAE3-ERU12]|uniref:hypothetical protein n=1 Tax=Corynebacterium sp. TAE3-ERU12 TaxID=2849491 RepID=UPI001C44DE14|nr:hypothetical protein [Corynebacterium sp. TAE3-ERU12]MBV7294373.1 hypothetical protein [Corynebacterium sp. TAE3-ERU12]
MTTDRLARIITEVCAPWITISLTLLVSGVAVGHTGLGIAAALLLGPGPIVGFILAHYTGHMTSGHHVTDRGERNIAFGIFGIGLIGVLVLFTFFDAGRVLWLILLSSVIVVLVLAGLTLLGGHKPSLHVASWVGGCGCCAVLASPWFALLLLLTPAVAWARVQISHHTVRQTIAGGIVGTLGPILLAIALAVF